MVRRWLLNHGSFNMVILDVKKLRTIFLNVKNVNNVRRINNVKSFFHLWYNYERYRPGCTMLLHHETAVGVYNTWTMVRLESWYYGPFYRGFYNGKNCKGDYSKEPWFDHDHASTMVSCDIENI